MGLSTSLDLSDLLSFDWICRLGSWCQTRTGADAALVFWMSRLRRGAVDSASLFQLCISVGRRN